MTAYIGIDPGLSGAVAIIKNGTVTIIDTPTMQVKKGKGKKTEYLPVEMADIFKPYCRDGHVFIEKIHSMPGQGVSSMFRMGEGYGLWVGIISALRLPLTKVAPQTWKKVMMAGLADKDAARGRAQELFPQASEFLKRKKDCDRADALLIADYGRRQGGKNETV